MCVEVDRRARWRAVAGRGLSLCLHECLLCVDSAQIFRPLLLLRFALPMSVQFLSSVIRFMNYF